MGPDTTGLILSPAPQPGQAAQRRSSGRVLRPLLLLALAACAAPPARSPVGQGGTKVLASTTFLADIAQQVAGDRLRVESLLPVGADPHAFQATPADLRKLADSDLLILNGAGFEANVDKLLAEAGGEHQVVEASAGLPPRVPKPGEPALEEGGGAGGAAVDPHFYLDPIAVQTYTDHIADALATADPSGASTYRANASAYKLKLAALDREIQGLVSPIPGPQRLLVTDHDDLGYFADRYGFRVVGMLVPNASSEAAPSAGQLAGLVRAIRSSGARAIFTEAGTSPKLAQQVAAETGVRVVTDLYAHSLSSQGGPAPSYLDMLRWDAGVITKALQGPPGASR